MLFYSKFRTEISCHIKQEFSEQTEHNQISAFYIFSILSSHSHINFSFSETPTLKDFRIRVVLWLPWHFQHLCVSAKWSISVAYCNKFSSFFSIWSRLCFHTHAIFFSHTTLFCCSVQNVISNLHFAVMQLQRWPVLASWCMPSMSL